LILTCVKATTSMDFRAITPADIYQPMSERVKTDP